MLPFDAINHFFKIGGRPLRIRYYTESFPGTGSVWDDGVIYTKSGNDFYTSGLIQELSGTKGSDDALLLEEGRIRYGDVKLFISGAIETTSGIKVWTIAPSGAAPNLPVYRVIEPGLHAPQYFGQTVYKQIYGRESYGGSLF